VVSEEMIKMKNVEGQIKPIIKHRLILVFVIIIITIPELCLLKTRKRGNL
jgi:hypothetical protein